MNVHDSMNFESGDTTFEPHSVRCHLAIIPEADGTFSVVVLNLPGVGSCGDTEEEAIENTRQAVAAVVASYEEGDTIPWLDHSYSIPEGAHLQWIVVDV